MIDIAICFLVLPLGAIAYIVWHGLKSHTLNRRALWPHCRASATLIGAVTWR